MLLCPPPDAVESSLRQHLRADVLSSRSPKQRSPLIRSMRLRSQSSFSDVEEAISHKRLPNPQLARWGARLQAAASSPNLHVMGEPDSPSSVVSVQDKLVGKSRRCEQTEADKAGDTPKDTGEEEAAALPTEHEAEARPAMLRVEQAVQPQPVKWKFSRACDSGLLSGLSQALQPAEAAPTVTSSWGWSLSMFGGAKTEARTEASSSHDSCSNVVAVRGTALLSGSLEEEQLGSLQDDLQQALSQVLASAAGPDLAVSVAHGQRVDDGLGPERCAKFHFEVYPTDPNDRGPVLEVLRLEARSAGARRLMPLLAESPSVARCLRLRLELMAD